MIRFPCTTLSYTCKRSCLFSLPLNASQISLVNHRYQASPSVLFVLPTKWQQAPRWWWRGGSKGAQQTWWRASLPDTSAGASQGHMTWTPSPPRGGVGWRSSVLPLRSCFVSHSLSLSLHNCFPPGQLLASSAVNLTIIICPPFTSSHEKWRMSRELNSKMRFEESSLIHLLFSYVFHWCFHTHSRFCVHQSHLFNLRGGLSFVYQLFVCELSSFVRRLW